MLFACCLLAVAVSTNIGRNVVCLLFACRCCFDQHWSKCCLLVVCLPLLFRPTLVEMLFACCLLAVAVSTNIVVGEGGETVDQ